MRFGTRLALFVTATLLVVGATTGVGVRFLLRDILIDDGKTQVVAAEARFHKQLTELGRSMAEGVRLLTLDFALRRAIADRDAATVLSALRNHGRRVGASRTILIDTDGTVAGDTSDDAAGAGAAFPFPALLDRAAEEEYAAMVAIVENKPVWLVVVPVLAPDPIAYIAAALPLDSARLLRMQDAIGLPGQLGLAARGPAGWRQVAGSMGDRLPEHLPLEGNEPTVVAFDGDEDIVLTRILAVPENSPAVMTVIGYPLSDALRRYQRILLGLVPALALGGGAALIGLAAIARGVSRPIEVLAGYTERIAAGDYTPPPPLARGDELGQLSVALHAMTRAISDREDRIRHQATHDPITGLTNRDAFLATVQAADPAGAMVVVALTAWRDTVRTVGREIGEGLMHDVGQRIASILPANVPLGAIGENAFAVYLPGADPAAARAIAAHIAELCDLPYRNADPYLEPGLNIDIPVAAGIALRPDHGSDPALLVRRAEVALLAAMQQQTRVASYDPDADPHRPMRLSLMNDLRVGLRRNEFQLLYQPKLDLRTNTITGAEALIRWQHPTQGFLPPDEFISLAEQTGNIQHVTRWVLRNGLLEASAWQAAGLSVRLAINLSVRDLSDEKLPERIAELLQNIGLPPRALVLEVTESAIMGEPERAIAVLRRLEQLGLDIAIDDFGVGQSSLAYLRRLPICEIKLDKSFIMQLRQNSDDRTIVRSVIELAHGLGYRVTAEGVEDAFGLDLLRSFGCDYAQGYYIARPLPAATFRALVASGPDPALGAPA